MLLRSKLLWPMLAGILCDPLGSTDRKSVGRGSSPPAPRQSPVCTLILISRRLFIHRFGDGAVQQIGATTCHPLGNQHQTAERVARLRSATGTVWFRARSALSNLAILRKIGQNTRFRHVSVDGGVKLCRRRRQFGSLRKALRGTNELRTSWRPGRGVDRCSRHRVSDLLLLVDRGGVGGACFRCVDDVRARSRRRQVRPARHRRFDWHDAIEFGSRVDPHDTVSFDWHDAIEFGSRVDWHDTISAGVRSGPRG